MEASNTASIIKVVSPFEFVLKISDSKSTMNVQLKQSNNRGFLHLLPQMHSRKVQYELEKSKSPAIRQQVRNGTIFFGQNELTSLYKESEQKVYMGSEINTVKSMICFVSKVECLKLQLICLQTLKFVTFYFSELKLIRVGNIHPKQMWQRSQSYFKQAIQGQFVQLTVAGSENYKEETNLFGTITRLRDKANIRQITIADGYAELSKESHKYLSKEDIDKCNKLRENAKKNNWGFWSTSKNISKSHVQTQEFKYKQWEDWIKEGKPISRLRNEDEQLKLVLEELNKLSGGYQKMEHHKLKTVIEIAMVFFQNQFSKRHLHFLEDMVRVICVTLSNIQIPFYQQIHNLDYIRSINKMLIFLLFHHEELEKLRQISKGQKINKNSAVDIEKCIKFIFKLCFLGNQTFHQKIFGKRKEHNYQNFNFEQVYLQGGISSMSQCSDYEDADKLSKEQKKERKLQSAHQKIRVNATSLMSFIFKLYPAIVENYWEMCVTPNILNKYFLNHVKKLRITTTEVKMGNDEKREIANFMRSNFGDHSLILLSIFERSSKVKSNSLLCLLNMITNFQGKKLIASTESAYIEKLLKETKSSFVPKSFIIFSGLRNTLYFLLFVLYHEKNLQVIILIFRILCELCNNCTLIDKMSFQDGIGLLLANYIVPLLRFQWTITQLEELKILCINFLAVLVNSSRKWPQIEQKYFKSPIDNLNLQLLDVIAHRKNVHEDKVVHEIISYFTRLCRHYYSSIFYSHQERSIWIFLKSSFIQHPHPSYPPFIEEIFKSHLDEAQKLNQPNNRQQSEPSIQTKQLNEFLLIFIKAYCQQMTPTNYLHLLNSLTYVDYEQWSSPTFLYAHNFLLHCFYSFVSNIENSEVSKGFPSIESLKGNALVRLALIKLVGYMSFCPEFQTEQITKKAVCHLLALSKQYKSFNSIVKITWGLSNWAKVPVFAASLNQSELKNCLDYMMAHSGSDKEKVASNCTRGIGFFACNVNKLFDLRQCRSNIIKNLSHPIVKVRTNSTKTLLNLTEELEESEIKELLPLLEQNLLKNNYHLQMESLKLLKKMGSPIPGKRLLGRFVSILKTLMNYSTIEYEFSEIKTVRKLRFTVLCQIFNISEQLKKNPELFKDVVEGVCGFLALDCKNIDTPEGNARINEVELEKTEEAESLIFNKKGSQGYNDEKKIESQVVNKGFAYKASEEQLELLVKIKEFCVVEQNSSRQWKKLSGLRVEGSTVFVDPSALQIGQGGEQYQYIVME